MKKLFAFISRLGIYPNDDDDTVLRKQFLVYQGLSMSMGGILWGTLLFAFNYPEPSIIPFGYTLITFVNFFFFSRYKNFPIARNVQAIISLVLPFLLQWFLGGFSVSGGVMLWSILALISSASYQNTKASLILFISFLGLTLFSLIYDSYFVENFNMGVKDYISLVFLVVNILCVSAIIFALMLYFSKMNFTNMEKLRVSYSKLIHSEKLAVLGQISAGVAHEINTPLGAIKSSAEESSHGFKEFIETLPVLMISLSPEEKDLFLGFLAGVKPQMEFLTTREEREKKKNIASKLEALGVENARFIGERLVKVGIYEITEEIAHLARHDKFEELTSVLYNLFNQQRNNATIQMAVEKASRIVSALKSYLHSTQSETAEPINVVANIDVVLTIYNNRLKQGITVVKNYAEVPDIIGFPDQLTQVWTNLIINAVQAMENKGTLTIGIRPVGNYVEVSIKDTGVGIPPEIQSKIFTPFFTTKLSGEGTGLGLDIIKRILDDHSAKVSFNSEVGRGTTFVVQLPIKIK